MVPAPRIEVTELPGRVWEFVTNCVRIDTRTLASFRIFVGLLIVADLLLRSRNFRYFYTDEGVVPRELALEYQPEYAFSFYHLTTDTTLIALLFVLQGLIALQLIVGYKTRLATILSFLFVVSLDHHNPLVLSYADTLFRLLLFWAIFLPLGERWSVDAVHRDRAPRSTIASLASGLILFQMVFMYIVNGIHKTQSDLWTSGDAAPLVLGITEMTFFLGDFVSDFPELLRAGGLLWFYMLVFSPLLFVLRGRLRMLMVGLFVGGHGAFAITVRIGAFPYVALAGVMLFLQTSFWTDARRLATWLGIDVDRLVERASRVERVAAYFPEVTLGGERVQRVRSGLYSATMVVIVGSILLVAATMFVQVGVPIGDDVYEDPARQAEVESVIEESSGSKQVHDVAVRLGIDQPSWSVFAPHPRNSDRYYVFPAMTDSGEMIDVYNDDRPLTYERPGTDLQTQYGTYRERFYMNSVRRGGGGNVTQILADHICETWEGPEGERLTHLELYHVSENITMETINTPHEREIESLWRIHAHGCGDNDPITIERPDRNALNEARGH